MRQDNLLSAHLDSPNKGFSKNLRLQRLQKGYKVSTAQLQCSTKQRLWESSGEFWGEASQPVSRLPGFFDLEQRVT
jgi:hypothetical protein